MLHLAREINMKKKLCFKTVSLLWKVGGRHFWRPHILTRLLFFLQCRYGNAFFLCGLYNSRSNKFALISEVSFNKLLSLLSHSHLYIFRAPNTFLFFFHAQRYRNSIDTTKYFYKKNKKYFSWFLFVCIVDTITFAVSTTTNDMAFTFIYPHEVELPLLGLVEFEYKVTASAVEEYDYCPTSRCDVHIGTSFHIESVTCEGRTLDVYAPGQDARRFRGLLEEAARNHYDRGECSVQVVDEVAGVSVRVLEILNLKAA